MQVQKNGACVLGVIYPDHGEGLGVLVCKLPGPCMMTWLVCNMCGVMLWLFSSFFAASSIHRIINIDSFVSGCAWILLSGVQCAHVNTN